MNAIPSFRTSSFGEQRPGRDGGGRGCGLLSNGADDEDDDDAEADVDDDDGRTVDGDEECTRRQSTEA